VLVEILTVFPKLIYIPALFFGEGLKRVFKGNPEIFLRYISQIGWGHFKGSPYIIVISQARGEKDIPPDIE